MSEIITADKIAEKNQEFRCRLALKMIDVPENVIYGLSGPLLFQMAHLCCVIDQPMQWRDALRWMHDHKGEIIAHANQVMREKYEQASSAAAEANGTTDGDNVVSPRERQPVCMGNDGVSLERAQDSTGGN